MRLAEWAAAVGLTGLASIAILAFALHPGRPTHPVWAGGPPGPTLERTRGTLELIDRATGTLRIVGEDDTIELQVDEGTTIFVHGRSQELGALKIGDEVCATWEPGPFMPAAQWVEPCTK